MLHLKYDTDFNFWTLSASLAVFKLPLLIISMFFCEGKCHDDENLLYWSALVGTSHPNCILRVWS